MRAAHRWDVPERYNIARDVCDKHERDRLAMVWEDWEGNERRVSFGELQDMSNRFANALEATGIERGDRVATLLPSLPETAAVFLGTYKRGAILLSMSVLYGDEGIEHRLRDSGARAVVTDSANRHRIPDGLVEKVFVMGGAGENDDVDFDATMERASADYEVADTAADDPAQLYYSSGTTGLAKGILHAHRYLLAHEEFEYCHDVRDGELFHGSGEWAWAAGICPLLGPWRYGAVALVQARKGGYDPEEHLRFLSKHGVENMFTTPTALRSMTGVEDAGKRYPLERLRVTCSAGEPLNPEVIRWFREQYGITVLDYYGLTESYPLCGNFPSVEVREGSMGRPVPGWDVQILDEDEQPLPPGERGEICLRARSNPHYPIGYWNRPEDTEEVFGGEWFHTKDAATADEDGYVWYAGRADDVIISAGYRIGPFEVESACVEHPAVKEAAAVAVAGRAPRRHRQGLHRARGRPRGLGRARRRDQEARARAPLGVRVPARDRVRRRPAEDADRQDPARRAAREGARAPRRPALALQSSASAIRARAQRRPLARAELRPRPHDRARRAPARRRARSACACGVRLTIVARPSSGSGRLSTRPSRSQRRHERGDRLLREPGAARDLAHAQAVLLEQRDQHGAVGGAHLGEALGREALRQQLVPALRRLGEQVAEVLTGRVRHLRGRSGAPGVVDQHTPGAIGPAPQDVRARSRHVHARAVGGGPLELPAVGDQRRVARLDHLLDRAAHAGLQRREALELGAD